MSGTSQDCLRNRVPSSLDLTCPTGMIDESGLCYKPCMQGYEPNESFCIFKCLSSDYPDPCDNLLCVKNSGT